METQDKAELTPFPFLKNPLEQDGIQKVALKTTMERGHRMNKTDRELYSRTLAPTNDMIRTMVNRLMEYCRMSSQELAVYLGVRPKAVYQLKAGKADPPLTLRRLIWFAYCYEFHTEILKDKINWATWGRAEVTLPKGLHRQTGEERFRNMETMRLWMATGAAPLSRRAIAEKFGVTVMAVRFMAREIGYKFLTKGKCRRPKGFEISQKWRSYSPWMNVNWNQSNKQIAYELGFTCEMVRKTRSQLHKWPKPKLTAHVIACGKDLANFARILQKSRRYKYKKKEVATSGAVGQTSPDDSGEQNTSTENTQVIQYEREPSSTSNINSTETGVGPGQS